MKIRCPKDETGASWFASEPSSILKEGSGIIKKLMPNRCLQGGCGVEQGTCTAE
jgi:hypothetical protein